MKRALLTATLCLTVAACGDKSLTSPSSTPPTVQTPPLALIAVVPAPGELPIGGGTASVWIATTSTGGVGVPNVPVTISASDGALSAEAVTTDATGHATVTWALERTASITVTAGELFTTQTLKVHTPVIPPEPSKPPQAPKPPDTTKPQEPLPDPLVISLIPASSSVTAGASQTYTASVVNLAPGETISYYTWVFETDATATTVVATRSYTYTTHGVKSPRVSAVSSNNRTGSATGTVIVVSPLR